MYRRDRRAGRHIAAPRGFDSRGGVLVFFAFFPRALKIRGAASKLLNKNRELTFWHYILSATAYSLLLHTLFYLSATIYSLLLHTLF